MKVLITEPYSLKSKAQLQAAGFEISESMDIKEGIRENIEERVNALASAEVLLIRSKTEVNGALLEKAPKLKLVVSATSGFDHIDWRACQERGVTASHTPNANAQSTAELAMTLMLATERHLLQAHKNVRGSKWRDNLKRPHGLEGKNLGIIGLGRVGRKVARMAATFGMRLHAHDPYVDENVFAEAGCERMGLIEALTTSDIVTLHVPLTKETKFLLNNPTFNEMQHEAILINTCRGHVVNENDLLLALDTGVIAAPPST
ncbi:MAG: 3-phosphoglycerate dehydrogenase [Bdellovibrionaceae bacterium]|nr:3-phosphoglycerate dehydrogenase [Pseudobdellovibrionaceae bacterium]